MLMSAANTREQYLFSANTEKYLQCATRTAWRSNYLAWRLGAQLVYVVGSLTYN